MPIQLRARSLLYLGSIFSSAFLLFLLEPLIAKMELPFFGGGPAVWNTCLVVFQLLLLAGYAYSHFIASRLGQRALILHAFVLLLPLAFFPPALDAGSAPVPGAWPVPALTLALLRSIGLPFFVLSTNSSLVQRWFSQEAPGEEPYFLYGASNFGSLLALAAYPFLLEPHLGLRGQARLFSYGYLLFVVITFLILWRIRRAPGDAARSESVRSESVRSESVRSDLALWTPRLKWLGLSSVSSLLLVAVSLRIATDVAAIPLLWVLPLALYLITFILAFSPLRLPRVAVVIAAMLAVTAVLGLETISVHQPLWRALLIPCAALFFGCLLCHSELWRARPEPRLLTSFYLWIAIGGCIGSLFANLAAPLLWTSIAEYPLAMVALALIVALGNSRALKQGKIVSTALGAGALLLWALLLARQDVWSSRWHLFPLFALLAAIALLRWPFIFASMAATAALLNLGGIHRTGSALETKRSFFGTLRVEENSDTRFLIHGTTIHGSQIIEPLRREPSSYYHPNTPMGRALHAQKSNARIAVVGLGTGSLAALTQAGQSLTYYELDPLVEPLARRWFTFLGDTRGTLQIVLGDARQTLQRAPSNSYDLLIVDAFSSDAIPVHLLTAEALALYLDKLRPDGLLVFHIENRYLDLAPVARALAENGHLHAAILRYVPDEDDEDEGAYASDGVAFSRSPATIDSLLASGWKPLEPGEELLWTDDRSSLYSILKNLTH